MAARMAEKFSRARVAVQWQQIEDGRANVLGTRAAPGDGQTLMFNGHMDTSYSGSEPWLRHPRVPAEGVRRATQRLYGLGISKMKGALACYVGRCARARRRGRAARSDLHRGSGVRRIEEAQ